MESKSLMRKMQEVRLFGGCRLQNPHMLLHGQNNNIMTDAPFLLSY